MNLSALARRTRSVDLQLMLQKGEGTTLEYKERLPSSFGRDLVSLANTLGGKILLGVRDDGSVAGVQDSNVLRARIQDIARNCDPAVQVDVEPMEDIIVVHVRESESKPVQCSEGFFWRQGAITQKLSRDELREFFRREGVIRFDCSITPRFKYPEEFDFEKFEAWRKLSGINANASVEDILVNLEIAERGEARLLMRNAGILFFARKPTRFFNHAYITCILFRGTERIDIIDRKDFSGGIVADIEDSMYFIERNTRVEYRIEKLRRENITEYPMKAVREAIANAVMHRDWFIEGANVFVEIYSDRLEVVSPGGLPAGLKEDELGHKSVRRNAVIADLLQRIDFIEKAGTGIDRMRQAARIHGSSEPEFKFGGFFTTVFRPLPIAIESAPQVPLKSPPSTRQVTSNELRVLKAARAPATRAELQEAAGLHDRKHFINAYLNPLLKSGLLEMTLPDKPRSSKQRYCLTKIGKDVLTAEGDL